MSIMSSPCCSRIRCEDGNLHVINNLERLELVDGRDFFSTLTAMPQSHPRWGRPLDQYAISYGHDSAKQRATLDSATVIKAHKAINQICKLGGHPNQVNQNNEANQITLSTLESVLKLALSPANFRDFACPPLVSGCIKLMAMVKQSGKSSVSCHSGNPPIPALPSESHSATNMDTSVSE